MQGRPDAGKRSCKAVYFDTVFNPGCRHTIDAVVVQVKPIERIFETRVMKNEYTCCQSDGESPDVDEAEEPILQHVANSGDEVGTKHRQVHER